MMNELNSTEMTQIQEHANDLKSMHAQRDKDYETYEQMYLMTWAQNKRQEARYRNMILTESTDARDKVMGSARLLFSEDPRWKVVTDTDSSSMIEKELTRMWDRAGRLANRPIHYDLITSAVLYSEFAAAITPTADMVKYLRKNRPADKSARMYWDADLREAERIAEITPFMVDPWNPRDGYPEFGRSDLISYYRETKSTPQKVKEIYGHCPGYENSKQSQEITLKVFYDRVFCAVWTDAGLVYLDEHGLPTIPIVSQIVDGSRLWSEPEYQRQPLLYGLAKSGLWNNQNLMLSIIYTTALAMGSKPKYIHKAPGGQPGKQIDFNYDDDVVELEAEEQFGPMAMNLLDPSLSQAYQLAQQRTEQATIYSQALGAPANKDTTFSEMSLLSQSGRLPLIGTQKCGSWGIGAIGEKMLWLIREMPEYRKATNIKAEDIPENIQIEANLDVKLPQDKLQLANIARMLTQGDNPLVSNEWTLENILGVEQPDIMQKQIWTERSSNAMYAIAQQEFMQPPQPQRPAENSNPAMTAGATMTPGQGQAVGGGLPAQMAGMIPGQGQATVPPEAQGGMPQ